MTPARDPDSEALRLEHESLLELHAEVERSHDYYSQLYDAAPIGYLTLNKAGEIVNINLSGAWLLSHERERLVGQSLLHFIAIQDRRRYLNHLLLCRQRPRQRLSTELRLKQKQDESFVAVELISSASTGKKDSQVYNSVLIDITRRKEAEESLRAARDQLEQRVRERTWELTRMNRALQVEILGRKEIERGLRESEERFRLLVDSSRDYAIFMLDPDGRVATWNESAERIQGYQARQILGRHCSQFYPGEDIASGKPFQVLEIARTMGRAEDEGWRVRRDGSRFYASAILTALRDEAGVMRGYSKVTRDITPRRRAEEALRLSEKKLSDFFDHSPVGLLWIGRRGKILRVNRASLDLLGCGLEDCLNHSIQEFHSDRKLAAEILHGLERQGILQNHRTQLRRKDGSKCYVLIDANGLWEDGQMVHSRWSLRDITRRVELEREVLVITERERRRIGRDLHDDLCQQLTGVEFLNQTLAARLEAGSPEQAGRARDIAHLVRQAITYTRELAHGLSPVDLETRGLNGALQELAARARKLFQIDCRFRGDKSDLRANPTLDIHLYRIAQEAVTNAHKHGRARRVDIGLSHRKKQLVLSVKDNGIGMRRQGEPPRDGGGMGLHVMQYRAGAINATLTIESNPGNGTRVTCKVSEFPEEKQQDITL